MSFFLCRLIDPALTEGFSDYSNLIAWGETFPSNYLCVRLGLLGVSLRPTNGGNSPRTALGDTAGPREGQWQPGGNPHGCTHAPAGPSGQALPDGCCLQLCSCLLHALGSLGEAGSAHPPSIWHRQHGQHGQCRQPSKSSVAEGVLGGQGGPQQPPLLHRGSAWVIFSIALFVSVQREKRLMVALKE